MERGREREERRKEANKYFFKAGRGREGGVDSRIDFATFFLYSKLKISGFVVNSISDPLRYSFIYS